MFVDGDRLVKLLFFLVLWPLVILLWPAFISPLLKNGTKFGGPESQIKPLVEYHIAGLVLHLLTAGIVMRTYSVFLGALVTLPLTVILFFSLPNFELAKNVRIKLGGQL